MLSIWLSALLFASSGDAVVRALAPPPGARRVGTPHVVPVPANVAPMPVPETNPLTREAVTLGRWLFYDPRVASDGKRACSACHQQRFAFADDKAVSDTHRVGARNSMPLFNLAWRKRFFWDGRVTRLEAAVDDALRNELEPDEPKLVARLKAAAMYGPLFARAFGDPRPTRERAVRAIASFLRTIVSFDSKVDRAMRGAYRMTALEQRGMKLLSVPLPEGSPDGRADFCNACHQAYAGLRPGAKGGGLFTGDLLRSNGLPERPGKEADAGRAAITHKAADQGRFLVPSVRNLGYTAPYMHDGRLATLEAVVRHYNEQIAAHPNLAPELTRGKVPFRLALSAADVQAVVAILRLFDDASLLTNPAYADPFAPAGAGKP